MAEIRMYTKEEVAKMANNYVTDLINELVIKYNFQNHKSIEQDRELERFKSLLKGSEGTIEQQRKVIDRYRTEIDKQKEEIKKLHQEEEIKAYCVHDICSTMEVASFYSKISSVDEKYEVCELRQAFDEKVRSPYGRWVQSRRCNEPDSDVGRCRF